MNDQLCLHSNPNGQHISFTHKNTVFTDPKVHYSLGRHTRGPKKSGYFQIGIAPSLRAGRQCLWYRSCANVLGSRLRIEKTLFILNMS